MKHGDVHVVDHTAYLADVPLPFNIAGVLWWNMMTGGFLKSYGLFYVEFLDLYGEGPTKTAWILSCFSIMYLVPGVLH